MSTAIETVVSEFRSLIKKIKAYEEAVGVMYWDLRTGAPKKAVEGRSEVIGTLSAEMFRLTVSDQMGQYLEQLTEPNAFAQLDKVNQKIVTECKKEYDRSKKIPPEEYEAYVVLTSKAESVWEEAKEKSDYAMFRPYLEQIVETNHRFIDLWGYEGAKYNTLLDMYEPGMTVSKLDQLFGSLREQLVPLVAAIRSSAHQPDSSFMTQAFPKEQQKSFNLFVLREMGYDFDAGRLDETVHPFATGLNIGDVRITTRYLPNDVSSALFGSIHEGGHALYEQNISPELVGTPLCTGTSMGIHESQSRFWENMIGRSRSFWSRYYDDLQRAFPEQLAHVSLDSFYRAINRVEPSLIRVEADELTYNLHIMIRYEMEKGLFDGSIQVADLPEVWRDKYEEYIGVVPENDGEGVLQDVHWSGGAFGYFPSYALGNMYAAQILNTIQSRLPRFEDDIAAGNFQSIKSWLTEQIYQYGKLLDPAELLSQVTGEELNANYLVDYLNTKYKKIYMI